ncbi:MAG TPA: acetamidase/formamidase family protein [Gaiellaceae bacterium]|nr:acetamidase/formamidase family protein [Gaiellaceae bacterium]
MRIPVDASRPLHEEPGTGHNRWSPDLDPIASVAPGTELTLETRDGLDGQLGRGSGSDDVVRLSLGRGHPLTGPVAVEGAEPGDLLVVDLLGYETADVGVTAIVPGFGFLADLFPDPYVAVWEIAGGLARSEALPGVAVPAAPFAGVVGVAPSPAFVERVRARERALRARGGPVADDSPETAVPASAAGGLRTIPPRESGGNLDVPQLGAGSRLLLPVQVPGALFSIGDLHFAQGEGEVCGTGIEVAGAVTVRLGLEKQPAWVPRFPVYETPARPGRRVFATTGIPLRDDGANEALDVGLAARRALLEMIGYLTDARGLGREQAYVLASVAVDLRLSEVVDVPNALVSALLPLDVFERRAGRGP